MLVSCSRCSSCARAEGAIAGVLKLPPRLTLPFQISFNCHNSAKESCFTVARLSGAACTRYACSLLIPSTPISPFMKRYLLNHQGKKRKQKRYFGMPTIPIFMERTTRIEDCSLLLFFVLFFWSFRSSLRQDVCNKTGLGSPHFASEGLEFLRGAQC
jgi:hypothetical protein